MMGRAGSWVGNSVAGLTLARFWFYQDFAAGSGPNLVLTGNDNGVGGDAWDSTKIVNGSAVVTDLDGNPIYDNAAADPSDMVEVTAHVSTAVTLSSTPAVGFGGVRIWYLYAMSSEGAPTDMEIAPLFVKEVRSEFLDARFLNQDLNLSDLSNPVSARTNLGYTNQTAGNVLLGDGSTTFTSDPTLFFDTGNKRLGVGTNAPTQLIHALSDTAPTILLSTQSANVPDFRFQAAGAANANLANADTIGLLSFYGRRAAATSLMGEIFVDYTGDGTTRIADFVVALSNAAAPAEVFRVKADGSIDTILGFGAVQSDASGILSSSILPIAAGGTGAITFTPGSIPFMGATVLEQDNANLFYDSTNDCLNIGGAAGNSPTYGALNVKAKSDSLGAHIQLEGPGVASTRFLYLNQRENGDFFAFNPGTGRVLLDYNNANNAWTIGQSGGTYQLNVVAAVPGTAPGTISAGSGLGLTNGDTTDGNFSVLAFQGSASGRTPDSAIYGIHDDHNGASSTGSIQIWTRSVGVFSRTVTFGADKSTNLAGQLQLSGATSGILGISAAAVTTDYNLVMPSAQGAARTTLYNNGSGTLSWQTLPVTKAGTIDLADGDLSKAVAFNTAMPSANYSVHISFKDLVSGDPLYQPYTIIAHAAAGFTAEWNDGGLGANVKMLWTVVEHYDP